MFTFSPRWREELVVTGPGGSFVLELDMGVLTARLPPEDAWAVRAPAWARADYATLRRELEAWCAANNAQFAVDPTAMVS